MCNCGLPGRQWANTRVTAECSGETEQQARVGEVENKERKNKSQHRGGAQGSCHFVLGGIKQPDKLPVYCLGNMIRQCGSRAVGMGIVAGGLSCECSALTWLRNSGDLVKSVGVVGAQC